MTLEVAVQYAVPRAGVPAARGLHAAARAAWRGEDSAGVTLRIVDADEGRELNHAFRGRDYATNVLSFPAPDDLIMPPGAGPACLGDIVLCDPVLQREAREQGKRVNDHYTHMVVHGMLHLQGFDHQDAGEAAEMEALETAILAGLGLPDPYRTAGADPGCDARGAHGL
ncbi:putative rRNA maturation factor [Thioalkalivibrio sp. ALE21]|uniref:rRNA maturation RNase YbeY n=1 Tax=Thioalkalivibrio sp. ALE21 TaxID=1158175 RepID=UPI000D82660E|nr:rRNA maturation RNase YbeY [Thioalkalivibrio sp. ALE21]PYG02988.1 putative rRNA maturation factor [Thioalkalivibrio sp. ALE21]